MTHEEILQAIEPVKERYNVIIEGELLHIQKPSYIGIDLSKLENIYDNETVIRVMAKGATITLWKDVNHTHVSIF